MIGVRDEGGGDGGRRDGRGALTFRAEKTWRQRRGSWERHVHTNRIDTFLVVLLFSLLLLHLNPGPLHAYIHPFTIYPVFLSHPLTREKG